jgi:hypothetical protein
VNKPRSPRINQADMGAFANSARSDGMVHSQQRERGGGADPFFL